MEEEEYGFSRTTEIILTVILTAINYYIWFS